MKRSWILIPAGALVLAVLLSGCTGKVDPEKAVTGKWTVRPMAVVAQSGKITDAAKGNTQMAVGFSKMLQSTTLEFRPDKTFTMQFMTQPLIGRWSVTEDEKGVNLNVETVGGQPVGATGSQMWKCSLEDKGERLVLEPNSKMGGDNSVHLSFEKAK